MDKWLTTIGEAIWGKFEPLLEKRLDSIETLAKAELAQWRADSMAMLSEALPEMAAEVAKQTVLTTFEHTQVDEAADAVSGVITGIVERLPRFPIILGGGR